MPSYLNRYVSKQLFIDRKWIGEKEIRNHFGMPEDKPCSDFLAHQVHCLFFVGEEKEASDIPKAINQLQFTVTSLISLGHRIEECLLLVDSLRKFQNVLTRKKGFLFDRNTQKFLIVKPHLRVRVVMKSEVVKKR